MIDQAAAAVGKSRTEFIMASALASAKNAILDQTIIRLDATAFQQLLDDLDREPSPEVQAKVTRLLSHNVIAS